MYSAPSFYYVYIMTNRSKTLYTGVTGNPERRVLEHKQGVKGEFAARYKIDRLVYFERFGDIQTAVAREKQIKGLLRIKKIALIVSMNPEWKDLSEAWSVRHQYQPDNTQILRQTLRMTAPRALAPALAVRPSTNNPHPLSS
jgi:putative endonuclease